MRKTICAAIAAMLLLSGGGAAPLPADPYAGMVQVESGYGTKMWVKEYPEVPVNPLRNWDGTAVDGITDENGVRYTVRDGVDISEHQGEIDWTKLAADGVDFAILRAGYRGYGAAGRLMEDAFFKQNIAGALENGVDVGVYFFSQATSAEEAEEEADFLLALLRSYPPERLALPVFFDWEYIELEEARTDDVANERMTDCALAFCERIRAAGYEAGIYAYRSLAYFGYDLSRIRDYPLWIGAVGTRPDFHYAFAVWQHSTEGAPDGVAVPVDLDRIFVPLTPPATAAPAPAAG